MQFIGTGDRILTENFVIGYLYTITFKTGIYSNSACIGIGDNFVMFQRAEPDLLFNLNISTADEVDTIELYDSGGGTNDYDDLLNRPQINSHTLTGNMSGADLGLQNTIPDLDTIRAGAAAGATAVQPAALSDYQPLISDLDTIRAGAAAGATAVQPADMTAALAAKQDTLSAAQLSAVNSGITSTDVAQIETNKNNISCIAYTNPFTIYADDSVELTGAGFIIPEGTAVNLPKGEYILSFTASTARTGTLVIDSGATEVYRGSVNIISGSNVFRFTISADCDSIRFASSASVTITNLMIISSIYYDSGQTEYIGETMTNAELTAKEQANENNISLLNAAKMVFTTKGYYLSQLNWTAMGTGMFYSDAESVTGISKIYAVSYTGASNLRATDMIVPTAAENNTKVRLLANTDTFANANAAVTITIIGTA